MIVFSNTTPIIALSSIQCLHLLPKLFGEIHLVVEVIEECSIGGPISVPPLLELDKGEKHTLDMACAYHKPIGLSSMKK